MTYAHTAVHFGLYRTGSTVSRTAGMAFTNGADMTYMYSSAGQALWYYVDPSGGSESCGAITPDYTYTYFVNDIVCTGNAAYYLYACCELYGGPTAAPTR